MTLTYHTPDHDLVEYVDADGRRTVLPPDSPVLAALLATGEEIAPYAAPPVTWDDIRARRADLLAACDWTQLPDSPLTDGQRGAWAAYRQALRDITDTYSDPAAVVWPQPPSA